MSINSTSHFLFVKEKREAVGKKEARELTIMVVARGLGRRRTTTTIRSSATTTSSCCLLQPTNLAYLVLFLFALLFVHHLSDIEDDVGYFYSGLDSSSGNFFLRRSDDPWTSLLRSSATNKLSISCDSVRHKLASHEWSDPNDGKLFARSVITQPSFQISVHNETYDPVRWKYIYETGTYYEDLVQSRFDTILSQAETNSKTSSLVVDVGANIGYYTLLSLAYDVPVLSFEINPANLVRLCESLQLNSDQNFEARNIIFHKGVSNQDGVELQVIVPKNPGQAFMKEMEYNSKNQDKSGVVNAKEISAHHAITTTITLDSLAHELGWLENTSSSSNNWKIIILKLDVEGKEPQIIEGARQLLESGRVENVLTEFRRMSRPTIQEAIQTLHDTGYTIVDDSSASAKKNSNKNYTPMTRQASEAYLQRLAAQSKGSGKNFDLWFKRAPTT